MTLGNQMSQISVESAQILTFALGECEVAPVKLTAN